MSDQRLALISNRGSRGSQQHSDIKQQICDFVGRHEFALHHVEQAAVD